MSPQEEVREGTIWDEGSLPTRPLVSAPELSGPVGRRFEQLELNQAKEGAEAMEEE